MAKAVIVKAEMIYRNGAQAHMVTYESGKIRFYSIDKTPASVAAWLEAHAEPREFMAPMVIAPAPLAVVAPATATEAPTAILVPGEVATTELVQVEAETVAESLTEATTETEAEAISLIHFGLTGREAVELAEDAAKVAKAASKAIKAVITAAPTIARVAGVVINATLDCINAAYIVLRSILVHLIWWAQDNAGTVKAGILSALRVSAGVALTIARAATACMLVGVAGAIKGARMASKAARATARECMAGWRMREEILAEDAA